MVHNSKNINFDTQIDQKDRITKHFSKIFLNVFQIVFFINYFNLSIPF